MTAEVFPRIGPRVEIHIPTPENHVKGAKGRIQATKRKSLLPRITMIVEQPINATFLQEISPTLRNGFQTRKMLHVAESPWEKIDPTLRKDFRIQKMPHAAESLWVRTDPTPRKGFQTLKMHHVAESPWVRTGRSKAEDLQNRFLSPTVKKQALAHRILGNQTMRPFPKNILKKATEDLRSQQTTRVGAKASEKLQKTWQQENCFKSRMRFA
jgi:hypothetical protein